MRASRFDPATGEPDYNLNDAEERSALTEDLLGLDEISRLIAERDMDTLENGQLILADLRKAFGERVTLSQARTRVKDLIITGRLQPRVETAEEAPVHRGQQQWKDHAEFMKTGGKNGGPPSMEEVRERERTNASFRAFVEKNRRAEMDPRQDPYVQQLYERNPHLDPDQQRATEVSPKTWEERRLIAWVQEYNKTPSERVKALRSPGLNPFGYVEYERNLQEAIDQKLI